MDDIDIKLHSSPASTLRESFDRLAKTWRRETEFCSYTGDIVLNFSYQQIIGLGPAVIPLILQDLQKEPDHWDWALAAITQTNAAEGAPAGDIKAISDAWLAWGKKQGFLE